jgi:hypothetical protein
MIATTINSSINVKPFLFLVLPGFWWMEIPPPVPPGGGDSLGMQRAMGVSGPYIVEVE